MPFSLQARIVFPVDRPPIERGVVTIDGERIVAVGAGAESGVPIHDLGDVALLPGLVNAHTHLEFGDLKEPLGKRGMALADWIPLVLAHRRKGARDVATAISAGCRESLAGGVTSVGEIATESATAYVGLSPLEMTAFVESIGFSRARAESALTSAVGQLDEYQNIRASADIRLGLSPHAPYTVSPRLLRRLVDAARVRRLPIAMHLAESADELELLERGTGRFQQLLEERSMWDPEVIPRGSSPFDYLQMLASAPLALVIHGNYLDRDEREFLATHSDRMSLVYCPRTHAYFGHPPYPLAESLAAGARVAIGTDSRASNPDLSVLAEMRYIARTHPNIAADAILQMGTLSGAQALGREQDCGSVTPGKLANLAAVPLALDATDKDNPAELLSAILSTSSGPLDVWYRGKNCSPSAEVTDA
jgi:aminodeoxyfutalosine deaminase